jgi:tetrahydromethanopterin S-methyltransferase subunit B
MSYQQQPPQFQPQQQFQPQGPMGMLHLTIQGSALTSSMIPPTVHLNGYPVPVRYGRNDIPVPAGPLHVAIYSQWIPVILLVALLAALG